MTLPSSERGRSISWEFPVSVRLGHVLQLANVRLIGDLHGRNVDEFARIRNCGKSTITELREIVRTLQAGGAEAPPVVPVKGDPTNALSIPEACRAYFWRNCRSRCDSAKHWGRAATENSAICTE